MRVMVQVPMQLEGLRHASKGDVVDLPERLARRQIALRRAIAAPEPAAKKRGAIPHDLESGRSGRQRSGKG